MCTLVHSLSNFPGNEKSFPEGGFPEGFSKLTFWRDHRRSNNKLLKRKSCRACHFLKKGSLAVNQFPWDEEDRKRGNVEPIWFVVGCYQEQWSWGIHSNLNLPHEIRKNRKKCPFYLEYSPGMSFQGAKSRLQALKENRRSMRERITLAVAFVSTALAIWKFLE